MDSYTKGQVDLISHIKEKTDQLAVNAETGNFIFDLLNFMQNLAPIEKK